MKDPNRFVCNVVKPAFLCVAGLLFALQAYAADPPTLDQYKPKDAQAAIKAISLGAADKQAFDATRVGTDFPKGTSHVLVWYRWSGSQPGHRVNVHWYHAGTKVLEQGDPLKTSSGSEAWALKTTGGALPAGSYKVDVLENGKVVTSIPFSIGGGVAMLDKYKPKSASASIKAVSLSASDSGNFDAKRAGTEFTEGVPNVVVYFVWDAAPKDMRVDARWLKDKKVVGERKLDLPKSAGFGEFSISALPVGNYTVELLENGEVVTAIPFKVRKAK